MSCCRKFFFEMFTIHCSLSVRRDLGRMKVCQGGGGRGAGTRQKF